MPPHISPLRRQEENESEVQHEEQDDGVSVTNTASEGDATSGVEATDNGGEPGCTVKHRKATVGFRTSELARSQDDNEPGARKALHGEDSERWKSVLRVEVSSVKQTACWDEVERPETEPISHIIFLLKRNQKRDGSI